MTGTVVWFTGLPSSGKSSLASEVRSRLLTAGTTACLLDGDVVRRILGPTLGYSVEERERFYAVLAELAAELARQGLIVLVPATAHRRDFRERARALAPRFIEVWVATPLAECQRRDDKGLYAAAAQGPSDLPGVGRDYENPEHPEVTARGGHDASAVEAIAQLLAAR